MNPTLLQQPYSIEYPLAQDNNKCVSHDQRFSNSSLPPHEYLERRSTGTVPNVNLGQSLALTAPGNLDYNGNLLGADASYSSSSHLILSPPASIDRASSGSTNASSASFLQSNVPKLTSSSVHGNENYSSTSNTYLPTSWTTQGLSDFSTGRTRAPSMHQHLSSPPQMYGPTLTMAGHYQHSRAPIMDPFNYSRVPLPLHDPISHRPRQILSPPFASGSYPPSFSSMPQQASGDPKGPPFDDTEMIGQLVTIRNQLLNVEISASIPKGFFKVDHKWTCYRRNYFTVTCSFSFVNPPADSQVYFQSKAHSQMERVREYAISISARTAAASNEDSQERGLVQHTPKRDKQTESVPTRQTISPSQPQQLNGLNGLSHSCLYPNNPPFAAELLGGFDSFSPQGSQTVSSSCVFERIQFQKATANNGKRRAQQQYFHVVVELQVKIGRPGESDNWVIVATKKSHPMVVRGRSPGHYKDNRRDSQSSMDRDRGGGGLGDGSSGGFNIPQQGGNPPSSMEWMASHPRHTHHYGHSSYAPMRAEPSDSSISPESSTTFTGSPGEEGSQNFDLRSFKAASMRDYSQPTLSSAPERMTIERMFPLRATGSEQEYADRDSQMYCSATGQHGQIPASFEFPASTIQPAMRVSS